MAEKTLTCKKAQALIGKYLKGDDLPPEDVIELEAHVDECKACKKVIDAKKAALMAMLDGGDEQPEEEPEVEEEPAADLGMDVPEGQSLEDFAAQLLMSQGVDVSEDEPEPEPEADEIDLDAAVAAATAAAEDEVDLDAAVASAMEKFTPENTGDGIGQDDLDAAIAAMQSEPEPEPEPEEFVQISDHVDSDLPELDFSDLDNFVPPSVSPEPAAAVAEEAHEEEKSATSARNLIEQFPIFARSNFKLFALSGALGLVLITMGVFVKNPTKVFGEKAMVSKKQADEEVDEEETSKQSADDEEEDSGDEHETKKSSHGDEEEGHKSEKESGHGEKTEHEAKPEKEHKPVKLEVDNHSGEFISAKSGGEIEHTSVKHGKTSVTPEHMGKPEHGETAHKPAAEHKPAVAHKAPAHKPVAKKPAHKPVAHKPKAHAKPKHKSAAHPKPKHVARKPAAKKPAPKRNTGIKIYDENGHEVH